MRAFYNYLSTIYLKSYGSNYDRMLSGVGCHASASPAVQDLRRHVFPISKNMPARIPSTGFADPCGPGHGTRLDTPGRAQFSHPYC